MVNKIFIMVGEPSADLHVSYLITAFKKINPDIYIFGTGGNLMKKAGAEILYHVNELSILGFTEIIKKLKYMAMVKNNLIGNIKDYSPDLIILVDYPGFNLRFAGELKSKFNIPIIYFIAPQVWAWGSGRLKTIKKLIDKMIVILP